MGDSGHKTKIKKKTTTTKKFKTKTKQKTSTSVFRVRFLLEEGWEKQTQFKQKTPNNKVNDYLSLTLLF